MALANLVIPDDVLILSVLGGGRSLGSSYKDTLRNGVGGTFTQVHPHARDMSAAHVVLKQLAILTVEKRLISCST